VKLAIFDERRLGVVTPDERSIVDVTALVPWYDPDPLSGWWRRLCRDFSTVAPRLSAARSPARPLDAVRLGPPVLNPGKVIACAVNYKEHAAEMRDGILARTGTDRAAWILEFDVFLKAPSSVVGPADAIVLPEKPLREGREIHHESELTFVIGSGGSHIAETEAHAHVLGYTIGLDITERGAGDRSRRKSWDTFTPLGPWITTADKVDPGDLEIRLEIGGTLRQSANTRDLVVGIPGIVAYASSIMRLEPGDVIMTGAPQGVGEIHDGDIVETTIRGLGRLRLPVRAAPGLRV
jgi:2-keto-4-pentenoate hydratase/2-oxohepta-3-ene-1,7-dioic acid hydratase in catechol pathway